MEEAKTKSINNPGAHKDKKPASKDKHEEEFTFISNWKLIAENILDATLHEGQIMFLIKWKGTDEAYFVPARDAHVLCPDLVIQFYEARIEWCDDEVSERKNELRAEAQQRRAAETFMAALVQGDGVRGAGRTGETECHGEGRGFGESEGTGGAETVGGTGGSARIGGTGGNRKTGPVPENGGGAVGGAGNPSPRDIYGGNREFFV